MIDDAENNHVLIIVPRSKNVSKKLNVASSKILELEIAIKLPGSAELDSSTTLGAQTIP